jgi:hypothetical protein
MQNAEMLIVRADRTRVSVITVRVANALNDFGPYGIIFMNACFIITVTMVMLLKDLGNYGIIFMNVFVVSRVAQSV